MCVCVCVFVYIYIYLLIYLLLSYQTKLYIVDCRMVNSLYIVKNVEGEVVVKLEILYVYLGGDTEASHENFGHNSRRF